jgi:hypothetical protein
MNKSFEIKNYISRKNLVRSVSLSILLALMVMGAVWKFTVPHASAAERPALETVRCSEEYGNFSLKGCYGWRSNESTDGVPGNPKPSVGIGLMTFDGNGSLEGAYKGNYNGTPVDITYHGLYVMNPNGTGILRFVENETGVSQDYEFVMVDGINEMFLVHTRPGVLQTLVMKKQ